MPLPRRRTSHLSFIQQLSVCIGQSPVLNGEALQPQEGMLAHEALERRHGRKNRKFRELPMWKDRGQCPNTNLRRSQYLLLKTGGPTHTGCSEISDGLSPKWHSQKPQILTVSQYSSFKMKLCGGAHRKGPLLSKESGCWMGRA